MTPKNTIRVKNNTNECFAGNIVEKVSPWDKLFRKFKKCKLSVDKLLCKEARNILQVLFKDERRKIMQEKLSENWKTKRTLENYKKNWVYQTKMLQQQAYVSIRLWHSFPGELQTLCKSCKWFC